MIGQLKDSKDRIHPLGGSPAMTVSYSPVMTVSEICDYLQIHRKTLYKMTKNNQIPHMRFGKEYRFNRAAIDAWTKRGY
jgi:excisionase family DNA binding protein